MTKTKPKPTIRLTASNLVRVRGGSGTELNNIIRNKKGDG